MSEFSEVKRLAEELEAKGPNKFFEDHEPLDIEFNVDYELRYRGASVMICCGGPTILIESDIGAVERYGEDGETMWFLSPNCKAAVEDYFHEIFQEIAP